MSDDGSGRRPEGWLFDEDAARPQPVQRRRPDFRSVNLWLNIGFVVVLLGLLIGAGSSPWFFVVAVAWAVTGFIAVSRSRRGRTRLPSLFDADPDSSRPTTTEKSD